MTKDVFRQPFASIYVCDTKNAAIWFFGEEEQRINWFSFTCPVHIFRLKALQGAVLLENGECSQVQIGRLYFCIPNGQSTAEIRNRIILVRSAFSRLQSCQWCWARNIVAAMDSALRLQNVASMGGRQKDVGGL